MKRTLWNDLIQGFLSFTSSLILVTTAAIAAPPPTEVGQCSNTFIQRIGTRLVDGSTGESVPVYAPAHTTLEAMVSVAGGRWRIEECFTVAKDQLGLSEYEVRSWCG